MKTIKHLTKDYQDRFNAWLSQKVKGGRRRGRKKLAIIDAPNYLKEVIIPIISSLAEHMPDHLIEIPDPDSYCISANDIYPIFIGRGPGKRMVGGLTYLEYKETQIYFVPINKRKVASERVPICSISQLEHILRNHLAILNGRVPVKEFNYGKSKLIKEKHLLHVA